MVDEKLLGKIFRAAANGVMKPYEPPQNIATGSMFHLPGSYDNARLIAGAFSAIAAVFEKIADAEEASGRSSDR